MICALFFSKPHSHAANEVRKILFLHMKLSNSWDVWRVKANSRLMTWVPKTWTDRGVSKWHDKCRLHWKGGCVLTVLLPLFTKKEALPQFFALAKFKETSLSSLWCCVATVLRQSHQFPWKCLFLNPPIFFIWPQKVFHCGQRMVRERVCLLLGLSKYLVFAF